MSGAAVTANEAVARTTQHRVYIHAPPQPGHGQTGAPPKSTPASTPIPEPHTAVSQPEMPHMAVEHGAASGWSLWSC